MKAIAVAEPPGGDQFMLLTEEDGVATSKRQALTRGPQHKDLIMLYELMPSRYLSADLARIDIVVHHN